MHGCECERDWLGKIARERVRAMTLYVRTCRLIYASNQQLNDSTLEVRVVVGQAIPAIIHAWNEVGLLASLPCEPNRPVWPWSCFS